nr:RNA degradosome polyphosphate kinase [Salmonella enterica subsp. enterica serovar Weltevreden]
FDEESNLQLASRLQQAGAVVIYGVVGYKTHAKMMLILRRENGELRRYAHLGTGNYHAGNARLYTDYSMLTSDDALCEDVSKLFSQLIGMG